MIKRLAIVLLILMTLFGSVYVGINFPDHLKFTYQDWIIELPLWFGMMGVVVIFTIFYFIIRLFSWVTRIPQKFSNWILKRKRIRAHSFTTQGLIEFTEGHWAPAEKHLLKAIHSGENPLINYIAAAKAAQEQGATQRRDNYLSLAQRMVPDAKIAVELSQAQLQMTSGQLEQALATLRHLQSIAPKHVFVLKLLQKLCVQLSDWENVIALLPDLRKQRVLSPHELHELEILAYQNYLYPANNMFSLQNLESRWLSYPRHMRHEPSIVAVYAQQLIDAGAHEKAEAILYQTIKKQWDDELVHLYGLAQTPNVAHQLAKAEKLLKEHPNHANLLLTLGRICLRHKLWGKAKAYLESSLALSPRPETYLVLANLESQLGQPLVATEYYREGLTKSLNKDTHKLPVIFTDTF